jgi:Zn-finger nucleic acid-binding protein
VDCPRCKTALKVEHHFGIEVDHCATCSGRWLDPHELDQLEATVPSTPEERQATIQYAKRESELDCPTCGKRMVAFNYRAYNLEIDTCSEEHGLWLDGGEEGKVRDIIEERVHSLKRSARAEDDWKTFLGGLRGGNRGIMDQLSSLFRGRRR